MKNHCTIKLLSLYITIALFILNPLYAAPSPLSAVESTYRDIPLLVTGGCGFNGCSKLIGEIYCKEYAQKYV